MRSRPSIANQARTSVKVNIDWRAYWDRFRELHGDPVPYKGRMLHPDGWTYSATDYKGPEWPPPADENELRTMQRHYWLIRRKLVRLERAHLWQQLKGLRELISSRSAPVNPESVVVDRDESTGKLTWTRSVVEPAEWETGRLKWLDDDIAACDQRIKELEGEQHGTQTKIHA